MKTSDERLKNKDEPREEPKIRQVVVGPEERGKFTKRKGVGGHGKTRVTCLRKKTSLERVNLDPDQPGDFGCQVDLWPEGSHRWGGGRG